MGFGTNGKTSQRVCGDVFGARAINRALANSSESEVRSLAKRVGIGFSALVEHLYNLDFIGEADRERLRYA